MAANNFQVDSQETGIGTGARTILLVQAPANIRVKVKGFKVFGKGTTNTDSPVKVELLTATGASGGTANTVYTSKRDGDVGETLQSVVTGNYGSQGTPAEPTYTSAVTVEVFECHPQTGYTIFFPAGEEYILKGGTFFGMRMTAVSNETMVGTLYLEE